MSNNTSQSNHFNYTTRSSASKRHQQQQQSIAMNNFNSSNNMAFNYEEPPYPYPYPYSNGPSMDMQPFYYPSPMPMNYTPYYPTPSSPTHGSAQQICYPPNGTNQLPYTGNSTSHSSSNGRN
ncbi:unnamed protein product [Rotaria magnacalcarata]|nr:unnamed protein product [Rotaria magnacalcarata]